MAVLVQQDVGRLRRNPGELPLQLRTGPSQARCQLGRCLHSKGLWVSRDQALGRVFTSPPQSQSESRKWRGGREGTAGRSRLPCPGHPTPMAWWARCTERRDRPAAHLQVPVDDEAVVHVLQAQDDLGRIKAHVGLGEDPVLGQVVVQVPA